MSRVFLCRDTTLDRPVVVKVLHPELAQAVSVERFRREIAVAARLQHPQVVPLLDAGEVDGLPWYSMPFVEGDSLRAELGRRGPLPIRDAVRVLRDIARALAYAHEQGIVHRDVKPENVLLTGGAATLTDFGVARAVGLSTTSGDRGLTSVGVALGTPAYMAPEQGAADPATDHRADLYALGVLAYELLAGALPFPHRAPAALLAAHATEVPADVRSKRPEVPPALGALVMALLAKAPADRPPSAVAVVDALEAVTVSGPVPARPIPRHVGVVAGVLAVVVALAALLWRGRGPERPASDDEVGGLEIEEIRHDTLPMVVRSFVNNTGDASLDAPLARARDAALRDIVARQVDRVILYTPVDAPREDTVRVTATLERDSASYWMQVKIGAGQGDPLWDFVTLHHPRARVDSALVEGASRVAGWAVSVREVPSLLFIEIDGRMYRLPPRLEALERLRDARAAIGSFSSQRPAEEARRMDPRWIGGFFFSGVLRDASLADSVVTREPLLAGLARTSFAVDAQRTAILPLARRGFPLGRAGLATLDLQLGRPREALSLVATLAVPSVTMEAYIALGDPAAAESVFRAMRPDDDFSLSAAAFVAGTMGDSGAVLRQVARRSQYPFNALRDLILAATEMKARGQDSLARRVIQRGLALVPIRDSTRSAVSFQHRAQLHRMVDDLDGARRWLREAKTRELDLYDAEVTTVQDALILAASGDSSRARFVADSLLVHGAQEKLHVARLHVTLGQREAALNVLRQAELHGSGSASARYDFDLIPLRTWPPFIEHFKPRDDDRPVRFVRSRNARRLDPSR